MRSVLITGCSSGFGVEAAVALAGRDWRVFASMRNLAKRARLDDALASSARRGAARVEVVQLDVTDPASVERAVKDVLAATGGTLDALVNNAGVSAAGAFEDLPDDEIRRVMETNFFGALAVTRAVLPAMRAQRRGRVVLVTSESAFYGSPGLSAYVASKWAVEGWAESLSHEVAPFGIQVVCVEPGAYRTDIWDTSPRFLPPEGSAYGVLADRVQRFADEQLIPRARDPREVGDTVAKALEARCPRFRYPVGPDATVMAAARGIVPHRVVAFAVQRVLGVPRSALP